jgi:hypothetical protein
MKQTEGRKSRETVPLNKIFLTYEGYNFCKKKQFSRRMHRFSSKTTKLVLLDSLLQEISYKKKMKMAGPMVGLIL